MNDCRPDPAFDPSRRHPRRRTAGSSARPGALRETLDAALTAYRFNDAANALYAFVWGKVCDWYVELAKPLFDDEGTAPETRATMAWVLDQCLVLMHPFMPFVTEALWGQIAERPKLLAHADWPGYGSELIDAATDAEMNWVFGLIDEIRSVRVADARPRRGQGDADRPRPRAGAGRGARSATRPSSHASPASSASRRQPRRRRAR